MKGIEVKFVVRLISFKNGNVLENFCYLISFRLTGLSRGTRHRLRRRSSSKVINGHHVEFVLGVRAQRSDAIEHCADATDLAEGLDNRSKEDNYQKPFHLYKGVLFPSPSLK